MTTLREAAQQALEALYEETAWFGPTPKGAAAITALRAALREAPTNQCGETCERANLCAVCARGLADGDNLSPTEPVAWLWQHRETGRPRVLMPNERTTTDDAAAWDVVGPLYLATPQRESPSPEAMTLKPLTEEEIQEMSQQHKFDSRMVKFVRLVERAHGIK